MRSKLLAFAVLSSLAFTALDVAPAAAQNGSICDSAVLQVLVWANGRVSVVGPNFQATGNKSVEVCNLNNSESCKGMLAQLQAAMLSGRTARFRMQRESTATLCTNVPENPGDVAYISLR